MFGTFKLKTVTQLHTTLKNSCITTAGYMESSKNQNICILSYVSLHSDCNQLFDKFSTLSIHRRWPRVRYYLGSFSSFAQEDSVRETPV